MDSRKRDASVFVDEGLAMPVAKHAKARHNETDLAAATPENGTSLATSHRLQHTALSDAHSMTKQEPGLHASPDIEGLFLQAAATNKTIQETFYNQLEGRDTRIKILELENEKLKAKAKTKDSTNGFTASGPISASRGRPVDRSSNVPSGDIPMSHSRELQDAKARIEELKSENQKLKGENEELKGERAEVRTEWKKARGEIMDLEQQLKFKYASTGQIDDVFVMKQFRNLVVCIEGLAKDYFSSIPFSSKARSKAKAKNVALFDGLTQLWDIEYLGKPCRKQYFIEAVIWHKIIDKLLSKPLTIWCEEVGSGLAVLHKKIWHTKTRSWQDVGRYHDLRVHVAETYKKVYGCDGPYLGDKPDAIAKRNEIVSEIDELIQNYRPKEQHMHLENIRDAVDKAVDLAYSMAMSKAQYAIRMGRALHVQEYYGFDFKPHAMQRIESGGWGEPPEPSTVDLMISPALVKWGTSAGQKYETCTVLWKSRVICGEEEEEVGTE
ncbi:hypothetical protein PG985_012665 [Apiospora marii]|uniref:Uncharacterized protein n=1 Tax=Apiospora marii TaxID=335849 RepID=A0ABR1RDS5_9PEZI